MVTSPESHNSSFSSRKSDPRKLIEAPPEVKCIKVFGSWGYLLHFPIAKSVASMDTQVTLASAGHHLTCLCWYSKRTEAGSREHEACLTRYQCRNIRRSHVQEDLVHHQ
jgi:hypothetical protein